jgi:hypothetical protein
LKMEPARYRIENGRRSVEPLIRLVGPAFDLDVFLCCAWPTLDIAFHISAERSWGWTRLKKLCMEDTRGKQRRHSASKFLCFHSSQGSMSFIVPMNHTISNVPKELCLTVGAHGRFANNGHRDRNDAFRFNPRHNAAGEIGIRITDGNAS